MKINNNENKLAEETSLYLLQHKKNPVLWFPWGNEAFEKAKSENKPIFLSIGYSSCHWCHVMAHESFEDQETADLMNELFINVKVDREERPDIDEIYMETVMLMTNHAGWPLSVFLTPQLKPFYGGTYFPLEAKQGFPSFKDILKSISAFYHDNKNNIDERCSKIIGYLKETSYQSSLVNLEEYISDKNITIDKIVDKTLPFYNNLLDKLDSISDKNYGGYGSSPKFPQPSKISAMLFSKNKHHRSHAIFTLDHIRCGGIMDQIGGGISRYSVDEKWLVPHFEKMLYDNAQIISLYAVGSALLLNENVSLAKEFSNTAENIFNYLERDLKCKKSGLYFSAEDADSEGEEGLFYTFLDEEFTKLFEKKFELYDFAKKYYKISSLGNFEGTHILTIPHDFKKFCAQVSIEIEEGIKFLNESKNILLQERNKRVRPALDNKCLLSWNSLAVTSFIQSAISLNNSNLLERGLNLLQNIFIHFKTPLGYQHVYINGQAKIEPFSDDLGFLLEACIEALFITGCEALISEILDISKTIHKNYIDPISGTLYFSKNQDDLINRPIKPEDNVIYSPNSAIFGSLTKFIVWLGATNNYDKISSSDHKMLESLALISVSNTVILSEKSPHACAKMLQKLKYLEHKNVIIINDKLNRIPSLTSFHHAFLTCVKKLNEYSVVGSDLNSKFDLLNIHEYSKELLKQESESKYSFCSIKGCSLPTDNLYNLF
ncbi:thioredoxin domain-containing protein [Silvanigrella aquatica]|uniref:Spermatogenesis-associated protein 20-like TRX domain-containing protein n=1 Tax=Silvanigrella aquatica TaxID=1915309 RepID=A0A1L4D431_9BACT|nr:thioredoxin domain-containing protein [Silvanigrella aquatica]APJ04974.1 hypothetical protein AXG55_14160 [Silvanigrella aquatica]